jgi:hypothetical protein
MQLTSQDGRSRRGDPYRPGERLDGRLLSPFFLGVDVLERVLDQLQPAPPAPAPRRQQAGKNRHAYMVEWTLTTGIGADTDESAEFPQPVLDIAPARISLTRKSAWSACPEVRVPLAR